MINKTLKELRLVTSITQADFAKQIGISKSYLSEIENGKKKATIDTLELYCSFFNMKMSSIFIIDENMHNMEEGKPLNLMTERKAREFCKVFKEKHKLQSLNVRQ